jgi:hypothetical protein
MECTLSIALDPEKRRKFTDEFAKSNDFNPLDAEKWYTIKLRDIKKTVYFYF